MSNLQDNTTYHPTGLLISHAAFGDANCELCGHAVKYQYEIINENDHSLLIGSDCILKFKCVSPFTNVAYISLEDIRIDMVKLMLLEFIKKGASKSFIDSLMKDDLIKKGYSPKQMIAIENIACGFRISYDIGWFKINLRTDHNISQLDAMIAHPNWNTLKFALSDTQMKRYKLA